MYNKRPPKEIKKGIESALDNLGIKGGEVRIVVRYGHYDVDFDCNGYSFSVQWFGKLRGYGVSGIEHCIGENGEEAGERINDGDYEGAIVHILAAIRGIEGGDSN